MKKLTLIVIGGLLAVLGLCGCGGTKTIDLNQYVSVTYDGYDGYGTAYAEFDSSRVYGDFEKALEDAGSKELDSVIFGYLDANSELSNGDTVTFEWYPDEEAIADFEKEYKVQLNYSDIDFKVDGLKDTSKLTQFDPFYKISVTFSGMSGSATATVQDNNTTDGLELSVDNTTDLSNGDVVMVHVDYDAAYMVSQGLAVVQDEKEYTVEGLDQYISKLEDIPEKLEQDMLDQLDDVIVSMYAEDENKDINNYDVLGYYLLVNKEDKFDTWSPLYNQFYIIYKANIHCTWEEYDEEKEEDVEKNEDVTAYKYMRLKNLILYGDGTGYVDLMDYSYPITGSWWASDNEDFESENGNYYAGYKDLNTLYNQCIASQKAEWVVETNIEQ